MVIDHKTYELFGKVLIQKLVLKPPFTFTIPVTDHACFLYMLEGGIQYKIDDEDRQLPNNHALFLNCIHSEKQLAATKVSSGNQLVVVNFHPEVLKRIYDRELPVVLQAPVNVISNKSVETINNDFLIQKYIEGLLFYFENPSLVNEDILILKLKEIILLLSQTQKAKSIQLIFSQILSPITYSFKQIIEANLFSQLTIDELAQQTNLSISSFKREFSKIYNDTPANYIKTKKLEKAAELLVTSDKRISGIAFECGFNDLANFTKSFSDKYNSSPTSYRAKLTKP